MATWRGANKKGQPRKIKLRKRKERETGPRKPYKPREKKPPPPVDMSRVNAAVSKIELAQQEALRRAPKSSEPAADAGKRGPAGKLFASCRNFDELQIRTQQE